MNNIGTITTAMLSSYIIDNSVMMGTLLPFHRTGVCVCKINFQLISHSNEQSGNNDNEIHQK
jgi:hypothetical protein